MSLPSLRAKRMFLENLMELEALATYHSHFLGCRPQMKFQRPFASKPYLGLDFSVFFAHQVALDIVSAARYIAPAVFVRPVWLDQSEAYKRHTHWFLA